MRGLVPCNQPVPQMTFTTMAELAAPESKRPRKSTWSSGVRNGTTTTRVAKQPFWRTSTAELAAAPGSIALPNIAWASLTGTGTCGTSGTHAGNKTGIFAGVWADNASSAPSKPKQSQIAAEAVRAAQHFGNTAAASNASVQYVIATATRNSSNGFGRQYCAYHSSTSSTVGNVAYTNLPYITDAGASCGANFNGLGPDAGITIVGGHEMGETITDQFPSTGWLDSGGAENGDKCAWISSGQGASADISLSSGTFPVQSLWSNAFNSGSGGCVLSYP
jgi:hypothetical protein